MKITADRDQFAAAVGRAAQGLPQNPATPIRAGMLIRVSGDHVHLACGDGDVTFIARLPLTEGVDEVDGFVLPGKMLTEMVRYLPKQEIMLDLGKQTVISSGRSSFTLHAKPGDEYPMWESPPGPRCQLDGSELAAGLRKVAPAASDDLPLLSGIQLSLNDGKLTLVATDKYKLGVTNLPIDSTVTSGSTATQPAKDYTETNDSTPMVTTETNAETAFLPARVAEKFARACEGNATVGWSGNLISLHAAGLQVITRQIAGQMPKGWQDIMQGERAWYPCDTAELTRAVRMAYVAGEGDAAGHQDKRIELVFSEGEIAVEAGGAHQVIEFSYDGCGTGGKEVTLAVGGKNLLAGLGGCGEQVNLAFTLPRKPLLLDSEGLRWLVQTRSENTSA